MEARRHTGPVMSTTVLECAAESRSSLAATAPTSGPAGIKHIVRFVGCVEQRGGGRAGG
jgi:hypothetical protein